MLLARSRYLFIKQHRPRFGDSVLAELRGVMDQAGHSPFWDALGGRFFGMTFPEADEFNAVHGTQFIADLFPKSPIYVSMLPESAKAVIGQPHPTGRAALKMLENENFDWDGYIDIFDGGPTVTARTDKIKTLVEAEWLRVAESNGGGANTMMLATGVMHDFVACYSHATKNDNGELIIDAEAMAMLGIGPGDLVLAVSR
jgi:arginine N-succinyltransferase